MVLLQLIDLDPDLLVEPCLEAQRLLVVPEPVVVVEVAVE